MHLAINLNVAPSTQNQTLSALLFLDRHVLHIEFTGYIDAVWTKRDQRVAVVLTKAEVQQMLEQYIRRAAHRRSHCIRPGTTRLVWS